MAENKKAYNVQLVDTFDNQYSPLVNVNSLYKADGESRIRPEIVSTITLNAGVVLPDESNTARNLYIPFTTSNNDHLASSSINNGPLQDITIGTLSVVELLSKISPIDWASILESYILERNNYFSLLNNNHNNVRPELSISQLKSASLWSNNPNNPSKWPSPITSPDPENENGVIINPRWIGWESKIIHNNGSILACSILSTYTSKVNTQNSKIYNLIIGAKDINYPENTPSAIYNNNVHRIKVKVEEINTDPVDGHVTHISHVEGTRHVEDVAYLSDLAKLYNDVSTSIRNISQSNGTYTAGNGIKINNKQISTRISSWNSHADWGDPGATHNAYDGLRLYYSSGGDLAGTVMCDGTTIDFYPHDHPDDNLRGKLHVIGGSGSSSGTSLDDITVTNGIQKPDSNTLRLRTDVFDVHSGTTVLKSQAIQINYNSSQGGNLIVGPNTGSDGQTVKITKGGITADSSITANAFYSLSDKSLKENITPIEGYDDIPEIVEFTWKNKNSKSYGVIAQDLQKIYPELVTEKEDNKLTVDYIATLSLTIKKLQNKIESLEERIQELENKA